MSVRRILSARLEWGIWRDAPLAFERRTDVQEGTGRQGVRDLIAWQKGVELTVAIYGATREWPSDERFGLTSQIRRAAVSVPSNIAEGHGRSGPNEFQHHVSIAYGSLCEVETHLVLAEQLGFLSQETSQHLLARVTEERKILNGLLRSLRQAR
jgi:four helix bundle protein